MAEAASCTMEPGLLALEAARRQSVDWSLPVTAAAQAAARDIAYAFGYVRPESGTYRAIQAVLDQLENPSSFSGNRDAWEKHGAGRGTFKKWKKALTAVLGTVVVDDDDADLAAALDKSAARLAEPQDSQALQRSPSFLVGAPSQPVVSNDMLWADAAAASGVSLAEALDKLTLSAGDRHAIAVVAADQAESDAADAARAAEATEQPATAANKEKARRAAAHVVAAHEAVEAAAHEAAREAAVRDDAREAEARQRAEAAASAAGSSSGDAPPPARADGASSSAAGQALTLPQRVRIHGVQTRTELNGTYGRATAFHAKSGRSKERVLLLPTKLEPAAEKAEEEKRCRMCLEGEGDGPLVQPCACRGSAKLIHKHCLEQWRRTGGGEDAAYRCGQCKDHYRDALSLELLSARLRAERTNGQTKTLTLNTLAMELQALGKYDEAEPLFREVLEAKREILGNRHPETLSCINNLGGVLQDTGDLAAAESLFREALAGQRSVLGSRHPYTLTSICNLGSLLEVKGDLAAAELLLRKALKGRRDTLGSRHPETLSSICNLGSLLCAKGDLTASESLTREALEVLRETLGNRHPNTLGTICNLGALMDSKGDLAAAEALMREALEGQRETLGSQHPATLASIHYLEDMLLEKKGDLAAAEPLCRALLKAYGV